MSDSDNEHNHAATAKTQAMATDAEPTAKAATRKPKTPAKAAATAAPKAAAPKAAATAAPKAAAAKAVATEPKPKAVAKAAKASAEPKDKAVSKARPTEVKTTTKKHKAAEATPDATAAEGVGGVAKKPALAEDIGSKKTKWTGELGTTLPDQDAVAKNTLPKVVVFQWCVCIWFAR